MNDKNQRAFYDLYLSGEMRNKSLWIKFEGEERNSSKSLEDQGENLRVCLFYKDPIVL